MTDSLGADLIPLPVIRMPAKARAFDPGKAALRWPRYPVFVVDGEVWPLPESPWDWYDPFEESRTDDLDARPYLHFDRVCPLSDGQLFEDEQRYAAGRIRSAQVLERAGGTEKTIPAFFEGYGPPERPEAYHPNEMQVAVRGTLGEVERLSVGWSRTLAYPEQVFRAQVCRFRWLRRLWYHSAKGKWREGLHYARLLWRIEDDVPLAHWLAEPETSEYPRVRQGWWRRVSQTTARKPTEDALRILNVTLFYFLQGHLRRCVPWAGVTVSTTAPLLPVAVSWRAESLLAALHITWWSDVQHGKLLEECQGGCGRVTKPGRRFCDDDRCRWRRAQRKKRNEERAQAQATALSLAKQKRRH